VGGSPTPPLPALAAIWEDARQMPERDRQAIPAEPNASEQPHDVLAAEQFAMPAPEEARRRGPIVLPADPTGATEPHDVLAAEEFAMPAPERRPPFAGTPKSRRSKAVPLAAGLGVLAVLRRRRRARRS
jgi:hypothetical protein